jgi:hypothetical protein
MPPKKEAPMELSLDWCWADDLACIEWYLEVLLENR